MVNTCIEHGVRLIVDYIPFFFSDLRCGSCSGGAGVFCDLFFLQIGTAYRSYDFTVDAIPPLACFEGNPPGVGPKYVVGLAQELGKVVELQRGRCREFVGRHCRWYGGFR